MGTIAGKLYTSEQPISASYSSYIVDAKQAQAVRLQTAGA